MYALAKFFGKIAFALKSKKRPDEAKNILIIRSGGIGDVLMSTPLARAIRENYPNAKITYFVGNWSKDVLLDNPNIDKIFSYDDMDIIGRKIRRITELIKKMRKERFDLCFNLEKSWHWGALAFLFGIKTRIGFDRLGEGFAHNIAVPFDGTKYELEYYLDMARSIGMKIKKSEMEIYLSEKEKNTSVEFIKKNRLKNKIMIGISPGGADNPAQQAFVKRWPIHKYTELINRLCDNNKKIIFVLFGGNNDFEACSQLENKIKNKEKVINAAGKFSIKESAAIMKHCRLFITHDSGPMHIAASLGIPLIALFGPTPAERFSPKNAAVVKSESECSPCYDIYGGFEKCKSRDCMEFIDKKKLIKILRNAGL